MYNDYFGMSHTPFRRDIPVNAMYESQKMKEILGRLRYVSDRNGFAVVTADPGCGKSSLIRKFADVLDHDRFVMIYLSDSKLTPRWLYAGMLNALGYDSFFYRGDSKRDLKKHLRHLREEMHLNVILVLDEAHLLEKETIEEFRFFLNEKFDSESPMPVVLVGQTELWTAKLRLPVYEGIRQRIDLLCTLPHLSRTESDEYIQSHLNYSGCDRHIFTDNAKEVIFTASGGIMRMINGICDKSLLYAYQNNNQLIDDYMVRRVIDQEMPWCKGVKAGIPTKGVAQ